MRWILLDEILLIKKGKKALSLTHAFKPEFSLEVLMIEMMAQTGGLLLGAETDFQKDLVFTKLESAEFLMKPQAEEKLWVEATSDHLKPEGAWLEGSIRNSEMEIAKSRFLLMNVGLLLPETKKPVTFNEHFMSHFKVIEKLQ